MGELRAAQILTLAAALPVAAYISVSVSHSFITLMTISTDNKILNKFYFVIFVVRSVVHKLY